MLGLQLWKVDRLSEKGIISTSKHHNKTSYFFRQVVPHELKYT
ncbi:MAG: hypothetical protein K0Q73_2074 [Paenibacillus sp.]|jgi:hypothetical protein|nr:hypothetical protein [Paenibacillus sp.]